jgi:hypothetical protein
LSRHPLRIAWSESRSPGTNFLMKTTLSLGGDSWIGRPRPKTGGWNHTSGSLLRWIKRETSSTPGKSGIPDVAWMSNPVKMKPSRYLTPRRNWRWDSLGRKSRQSHRSDDRYRRPLANQICSTKRTLSVASGFTDFRHHGRCDGRGFVSPGMPDVGQNSSDVLIGAE